MHYTGVQCLTFSVIDELLKVCFLGMYWIETFPQVAASILL